MHRLILIVALLLSSQAFGEINTVEKALYPIGSRSHPVKIVYQEDAYPKGVSTAYAANKVVALDAEAQFIEQVMAVNAGGNPDELLDLWGPKDKADLQKKIKDDPELLRKNANFFAQISNTEYIKKIYYGDTILMVVNHIGDFGNRKSFKKVYPIRKADGGFILTNELKSDVFYMYIIDLLY